MKELVTLVKKQLTFTVARADMQPVMLILGIFALSRAWSVFVMWHLGGWGQGDLSIAYGVPREGKNPIFFLLLNFSPPWLWIMVYIVLGLLTFIGLLRIHPRLVAIASMMGLMVWTFHAIIFFTLTDDKARIALFVIMAFNSAWVYFREAWTPKAF